MRNAIDRRRRSLPVELLTRGELPARPLYLVSYVDEDASGEPRYVQQLVTPPSFPTLPPAA